MVPEDGSIHCARCSGATEDAPATSELSLLDDPVTPEGAGFKSSDDSMEDLDLFSSETIAQKRSKPAPSEETTLHLIEDDVFGLSSEEDSPDYDLSEMEEAIDFEGEDEDTEATEETESWQFDCLACAVRLAVETVEEKSKLQCPRCETWMVIDIDGEVILPGAEFGAPEPSCSSEELEQLRQEVHRIADGIGQSDFDDDHFGEDSFDENYDESQQTPIELESNSSIPTSPSPAALEAAEMQASTGDVITTTDDMTAEEETDEETTPEEIEEDLFETITTPADDYSAAISALEDGEDLVEVDFGAENKAPALTPHTVGVYTMLFALPSMIVMSAWFAGPGSIAHEALMRFGTQVQQNGGQLLDQVARFFASL